MTPPKPKAEDALLAGLARLPPTVAKPDTSAATQVSTTLPKARPQTVSRSRPPRPTTASPQREAEAPLHRQLRHDSFITTRMHQAYAPAPVRTDPLAPISRADMLEVIEHATGLGSQSGHGGGSGGSERGGERAAADRLLMHVRAGSVDVVPMFRGIVAGSDGANPRFNARVLWLVHWLCVMGGPTVLQGALHTAHARRPVVALRIVMDVLRTAGHDVPEDIVHDDDVVHKMTLQADAHKSRGRALSLVSAVEAYAVLLGRKLIFHQRYADVEVNYSLDRFYRNLHVENADAERRQANEERQAVIISHAALADISLITRIAVTTAKLLKAGNVAPEIYQLVLGEAANAYMFAEYLRMKTGMIDIPEYDLRQEAIWLSSTLTKTIQTAGSELRMMRKYVDTLVMRALTDAETRPCRPESRHRREIACHFTSFHALHKAVAPTPSLRSHAHAHGHGNGHGRARGRAHADNEH